MYSWIIITLLSLSGPALSLQVHPRHSNNDAKRIARALDIHADAIFPPHAGRDVEIEERGLLGGVGSLVNGVLDGVATLVDNTGNVVATVLGAGTGSTTTIVAANPVTSSPQAADTPSAAATQTSSANGNNTPGTTSAASNNNGNGNNGSNNSNSGGSASASSAGNSVSLGSNSPLNAVYTGTFPILVTDHEGHTHTVTGSGAITLTWVTTLPNGVVSTVTEIITPTVTAQGSSPTGQTALTPSKIAAIAGTLVTIFLIIFIFSFVLLLARKKRKAMQRANSNRDSSLSFGTSDMMHADDTALLHPAASTSSFRTAPCNIDGHKLDFPLPPVPSAADDQSNSNHLGTAGSSRPISMGSEGTFDLLERRSRTSLIADRNFYRKIGQYPEAGTYTPFAIPPSSDYNPSEEGHGGVNAGNLSAALARTKSAKSFHEVWRGSKIMDPSTPLPASENPFNDPSPITPPAPAASSPPSSFPGTQGRSGLWRKTTFGSSKGAQPSIQGTLDSASDSPAYTTADSSLSGKDSNLARGNSSASQNATVSPRRQTVISLGNSEYETATEAMSCESTGNFSYHSAFARYANDNENPFADHTEGRPGSEGKGSANESSGKGSSNDVREERITSSGWRPMTAKSTAEFSVMSSSAYSSDLNREMGGTPDPRDLFYHPPSTGYTDRPNTGSDRPLTGDRPATAHREFAGRPSAESGNATSEGEKTIRQAQVSYPSLAEAAARMEGTSSTWRPATTR